MKKIFHKHINILQAFKVIPKTVNCALPTMWKSTIPSASPWLKFVIIKLRTAMATSSISCMKSVPHAMELSIWASNRNHKAKGPVSMVDSPVLPITSVVADP